MITTKSIDVAENVDVDVMKQKYNRSDKQDLPEYISILAVLDMFSKDISVLDRKEKGQSKSKQKYSALKRKYINERKGLKVIMEGLKQCFVAKKAKMVRYD